MATPEELRQEAEAMPRILAALDSVDDAIRIVWRMGDGNGGYILEELFRRYGMPPPRRHQGRRGAEHHIDADLRRQVYERDAYRCVSCGGHRDLTCDHIVPVGRDGVTDLANLQTMCRPCNARKGARLDG